MLQVNKLLELNPFWPYFDDYMNRYFDLYVWFMVQGHFFPHYLIGKQDEWKDWVGSSTNGWGPNAFSICKN